MGSNRHQHVYRRNQCAAGTLQIGNNGATGSIPTANLTVATGAKLAYNLASFTATPLSVAGNLAYQASGALTLPAGTYAANQLNISGVNTTVTGNLVINAGPGGAIITGTTTAATAGINAGARRDITTSGDVTFVGSTTTSSANVDGISLGGLFTAISGTLTFDGTAGTGAAYGLECGVSGTYTALITTSGNVVFKGTGAAEAGADMIPI